MHKYITLGDIGGEKEDEYWTDHMPKDIRACHDCDYGVAFWDGKSRATEKNIQRLSTFGKRVIVGDVPTTENRCYIGTPTGGNFIVVRCCQTGKPQYCYTEDMFERADGIQEFLVESLGVQTLPKEHHILCDSTIKSCPTDNLRIRDNNHPNVLIINTSFTLTKLPWYFELFLNMIMSTGSHIVLYCPNSNSLLIQHYLFKSAYKNVTVVHDDIIGCGCCLGDWKTVGFSKPVLEEVVDCCDYCVHLTGEMVMADSAVFHKVANICQLGAKKYILFYYKPIGADQGVMDVSTFGCERSAVTKVHYTIADFCCKEISLAIGKKHIMGFDKEDVYADIVDPHHPNVCVVDDTGTPEQLPWYFCLFLNMVMSTGSRIIVDGNARSEHVQMHLLTANYSNVVVLGTNADHCNVGKWKFVYVNGDVTDAMMWCSQYSIYLSYEIFHRCFEYGIPRITFFRDSIGDNIMRAPVVDTSGKWLFDKSYTKQEFCSKRGLSDICRKYIIGFEDFPDNCPILGTEE